MGDLISPYAYFEIPEFNGCCGFDVNDLYRHVDFYLNYTHPAAASPAPQPHRHRLLIGQRLSWTHHVEDVTDSGDVRRSYTLKLPKHHRLQILASYLEHVTSRAEEFERVSSERRLFTNTGHGSGAFKSWWASIPFRHHSTFETLALKHDMKKQIT